MLPFRNATFVAREGLLSESINRVGAEGAVDALLRRVGTRGRPFKPVLFATCNTSPASERASEHASLPAYLHRFALLGQVDATMIVDET